MPDNHGNLVKVLPSNDPSIRLAIVQRPDGYFSIRPEKFKSFPDTTIFSRWLPAESVSGIFASIDLAEKEAYASYTHRYDLKSANNLQADTLTRRFTRLTNAFSKKRDSHIHALALTSRPIISLGSTKRYACLLLWLQASQIDF
jgi:hypothetical protein